MAPALWFESQEQPLSPLIRETSLRHHEVLERADLSIDLNFAPSPFDQDRGQFG